MASPIQILRHCRHSADRLPVDSPPARSPLELLCSLLLAAAPSRIHRSRQMVGGCHRPLHRPIRAQHERQRVRWRARRSAEAFWRVSADGLNKLHRRGVCGLSTPTQAFGQSACGCQMEQPPVQKRNRKPLNLGWDGRALGYISPAKRALRYVRVYLPVLCGTGEYKWNRCIT